MRTKEELFKALYQMEQGKNYLIQWFSTCPQFVIASIRLGKIPAGTDLIRAGTACDSVYVILNGYANGIDHQTLGVLYMFAEFGVTDVVGDYEVLGGVEEYRVSVRTSTPCDVLVIPAKVYLEWMQRDVDALFMRTQRLMNQLSMQTSGDRKKLFLTCKDRLVLYLLEHYDKNSGIGTYKLRQTQYQLADRLGVNVKTISRSIHSLAQDGLILSDAGKMCITVEQYEQLKKYAQKHGIL